MMRYLTKLITFEGGKYSVSHKGGKFTFGTLTEAKQFCKDIFEEECLSIWAI